LFGECSNSDSSVLVLTNQIESKQLDLLEDELANLRAAGYELHQARTQCFLNYFKVVTIASLPLKPEFCDDRNLNYALLLLKVIVDSNSLVTRLGDLEEAIPLTPVEYESLPLKKDREHVDERYTGLDKVEHKIVKGDQELRSVYRNRVYIKVPPKIAPEKLFELMNYLQNSIAIPNKLIFDEYQEGQLSFRPSRMFSIKPVAKKELNSVEGVAEAVYKRRKDIQTLSGVRVEETGIGSGYDAVPVISEGRDKLFIPILVICATTGTALLGFLVVHQLRRRRLKSFNSNSINDLAEEIERKPSTVYQDLCRHRMTTRDASNSGSNSKNSSTSSWFTFLKEHLQNPKKIEEQWALLKNYVNPNSCSSIAELDRNKDKNPSQNLDDDTLISIQTPTNTDEGSSSFINASAIHDTDPKQANYIATQSPLPNTIASFWQMVWEQGAVLIVNLADDDDLRNNRCTRYWPQNGSECHSVFEIHLVSEHIWSEDYLVRSFYLKNLQTNETRTITQFHYLTWPEHGVPSTTKALLEFRRKVNKSYRGKAAPIIVHCTDGIGRTGTYCLLDILNIAGSLEHIRDQRRGMVDSIEQYKLVFICVAEEVTAILKALPR
uniref:Protein-tyrosine-phosphatase n=1 Tax=Syphacia muris TaxID=451379 RepID=A0A158R462_9BILA